MNQALAQYRNIQADTSNPGSLLLLLYDKILLELQRARVALVNGGPEGLHRLPLMKAQLGVMELDKTLNWNVLADLAESLHNLYLHILLLLGDAFSHADIDALGRAENLLGSLRSTWKEAIRAEQQRAKAV